MIIAKAPLRISIGGGGTDLPSYYQHFGSTFISVAINKYVYISVHPNFHNDYILKYSEVERIGKIENIKHPIFREVLKLFPQQKFLEISSFADIPSGTGLGSSSTFTVALLKALNTYFNILHDPLKLAELACEIEIDILGSPIGKQDQYISSLGGMTRFEINRKGQVTASPLAMKKSDLVDLEEHLLLFFTGFSRSANELLSEQQNKTFEALKDHKISQDIIENLHFVKELGIKIGKVLQEGKIEEFGVLLNTHWEYKKQRSKNISNKQIDAWYDLALQNGAYGGKLIGAGGGGFLMFLTDEKRRLRKAMQETGLQEINFKFDFCGAQVVLQDR